MSPKRQLEVAIFNATLFTYFFLLPFAVKTHFLRMICKHINYAWGSEFCDILLGGLGFETERDRGGGQKSPI